MRLCACVSMIYLHMWVSYVCMYIIETWITLICTIRREKPQQRQEEEGKEKTKAKDKSNQLSERERERELRERERSELFFYPPLCRSSSAEPLSRMMKVDLRVFISPSIQEEEGNRRKCSFSTNVIIAGFLSS